MKINLENLLQFILISFLSTSFGVGCYFDASMKKGTGSLSSNTLSDTTAPTVPTNLIHAVWSDVTTETPALSWTASTDVGSGVDHYLVRVIKNSDSTVVVNWQKLTSGGKITGISLVLGTNYYFELKAVDVAGNESAVAQSTQFLISSPNTLAFTGNSVSTATALTRSFNELSSPAWTLTGNCNPHDGDVTISGDLDASFIVSCTTSATSAGSFSVVINNISSTISPHFGLDAIHNAFTVKKLGRTLIAKQNTNKIETEVFETSSSSPPLYISTYTAFKNAPDSSIMILEADIDLSNGGTIVGSNWAITEFGVSFGGIIEGNGKTIRNLNSSSSSSSGLVSDNSGVVRNLIFDSAYLAAPGAISPQKIGVVTNINNNLIEKITVTNTTLNATQTLTIVGGIVALNNGFIYNSKVNITISGVGNFVGGISGSSQQVYGFIGISGCYVEGSITGGNRVGGIAGSLYGTAFGSFQGKIFDSLNEASVSGAYSGGIVGELTDTYNLITNSLNVGSVTATTAGGKLIGLDTGGSANIVNSFVKNTSTCTGCTNSLGTPLSDPQLLDSANYTSWDFVTKWVISISKGFAIPLL